MQMKEKYSWAKHVDFSIVDLTALILSFYLAFFMKFNHFQIGESWRKFLAILVLLNAVICLVGNPYSGILRRRYYHEIGRAFLIVICNALSVMLILYALKIGADYSREVVIYTYLLYFFISVVLKYAWKQLVISGKVRVHNTRKTALCIISRPEKLQEDIHSIYSTELPLYDIRGVYLVSSVESQEQFVSFQSLKMGMEIPVVKDGLVQYVLGNGIDEVLVCVPPDELDSGIYQDLIANGVSVNIVVESMLGFQTEEQFISTVGVNKVLSMGMFSFSPSQMSYFFVKRLFDIFCGLIGVAVLVPTTLFVKLAYLISGDKAKIFYRQERIGLNGRHIRMWKYRSMVPDAGAILQKMLEEEKYRKEWEANQKFENDPRITKVGKFLRKTSIDELPQLLNVLIGDMSLVGPRPLVEGELAAHNGLKLYEKVKPGITGWWGCNGRSNIDYRERLELEYYYVKNCSFYLDVLCIIRTMWAVIKRDGAQ